MRILWLILLFLLSSCASYQGHRDVPRAIQSGEYDLAIKELKESLDDDHKILSLLNLGMLQRIKGDYKASNTSWERAKKLIDQLRATSVTETTESFVLNDNSISYTGSYLEQQWLHVFIALNYLDTNQPSEARVEMLQADQLHREFGETYAEPAFLRYIAGMIYEDLGEYDEALVSYRKAIKLYQEEGIISTFLLLDAARMLKRLGQSSELATLIEKYRLDQRSIDKTPNLTIFWLQGIISQKEEKRIVRFAPEVNQSFTIALPYYPPASPPLSKTTLKTDTGITLVFRPGANIDESIREEFSKKEFKIIAKSLARQVLKVQLSNSVVNSAVANNGKDNKKGNNTISAIGNLAGSLYTILSESADLRSWNTLPYRILIYRGRVPVATTFNLNDRKVSIEDDQDQVFYSTYLVP